MHLKRLNNQQMTNWVSYMASFVWVVLSYSHSYIVFWFAGCQILFTLIVVYHSAHWPVVIVNVISVPLSPVIRFVIERPVLSNFVCCEAGLVLLDVSLCIHSSYLLFSLPPSLSVPVVVVRHSSLEDVRGLRNGLSQLQASSSPLASHKLFIGFYLCIIYLSFFLV